MSRFEESLRERFHSNEPKERTDYSHGSAYSDERGNKYMDDHINGVDWHIPERDNEDENEEHEY
jgi:hypothetical protein